MEKSGEEEPLFSDPEREQVPAVGPGAEAGRFDGQPSEADPALLGEFITESRDLIASAEAALLELETDPKNTEALNTVFRAIHTIKGTSVFLGLDHISKLAHRAESFLSRLRDKEIRFIGGYADLAFRSVDMIKDLIKIAQDGLGGEPMAAPDGLDALMALLAEALLAEPEATGTFETIYDEAGGTAEMPPRVDDILVAQGKADREEMEAAVADQANQPVGMAVVRSKIASLTEVGRALRKQRGMGGSQTRGRIVSPGAH